MTLKVKEIILSVVMVVIMLAAVGINVYLVENGKIEAARQAEEDARMEQEMLEEIRSEEAREIAEFDQDYGALKDEFADEAGELSEKLDSYVKNIDELKEITQQSMDASKGLKEYLSNMEIPAPLDDYYELEMKFLESDIEAAAQVILYYSNSSYSTFDDTGIARALQERDYWLSEAEEERERIYSQYDLEYLLES
jgi:type II secretory pathway pseudopilin PulG